MSTSCGWEGKGKYGSFRLDERVGVQVKLRNPLRTRAIPERFLGGDDSPHYEDALYQVYALIPYLYLSWFMPPVPTHLISIPPIR